MAENSAGNAKKGKYFTDFRALEPVILDFRAWQRRDTDLKVARPVEQHGRKMPRVRVSFTLVTERAWLLARLL